MIVNLLRFRFRPETSAAQRDEVLALMKRTASIDAVSFAVVGQDLGDPEDGFTHAYCVAVADLAALKRYMYDPVHLAGDRDILPHLARLSAVRLADDMDPHFAETILALHLEKVAAYPEWDTLLRAIPDLNVASRP